MNDLHEKWPHRWISSKVKLIQSPIQGLGVKAIRPIAKGEMVVIFGGIIIPKNEIKSYRKIMGHIGVQIDDNFFICPTTRKELNKTGAVNHSCNPNCGLESDIKLIAIKNIKKEEELTFDYATFESFFKPFKCKCGSKDCRRTIKPTDWKNKKIQKKLGKYFSPYLKRKI